MDKFQNIYYKPLESGNDDNINITDDITNTITNNINKHDNDLSMYMSAIDESKPPESTPNKIYRPAMSNTAVYYKKSAGDNRHKYVNGETLNSYLSIRDLQDDAKETVDICRSNIQKVYERDAQLTELDEKSTNLLGSAHKFNKTSRRLKRQLCIKYMFHILFMVLMVILIIFLIVKLT